MTVGDLLDMLGALHAACEDVEPPLSDDDWRALEIVVRGSDEDGNDFCGDLRSVDIEEACGGDGEIFLALDASNEPETETP